eukprot:614695_1
MVCCVFERVDGRIWRHIVFVLMDMNLVHLVHDLFAPRANNVDMVLIMRITCAKQIAPWCCVMDTEVSKNCMDYIVELRDLICDLWGGIEFDFGKDLCEK